jgi:uncharacterized protein
VGWLVHNLAGIFSTTFVHVLLVVFVATLIRSSLGFGEALVAVPLLALNIRLEIAAPLAVLTSITIASVVVAQDWRKIQVRSIGWLMAATVCGIPIGLLLLTSSHQRLTKASLGVLIVGFSLYSLVGSRPPELRTDKMSWLLGCGFLAGIMGGAFGMNGPAIAVYGAMRRWSAQQFRATLQGYFLPASFLGMAGFWAKGLWVPTVTRYYLLSLPVVLLAVPIGRALNQRLRTEAFLKYVYGGLTAVGLILLAQVFKQ